MKPFARPDDPQTSTCWDCGFTWRNGTDGSHSCVQELHAIMGVLADALERCRVLIVSVNDAHRPGTAIPGWGASGGGMNVLFAAEDALRRAGKLRPGPEQSPA